MTKVFRMLKGLTILAGAALVAAPAAAQQANTQTIGTAQTEVVRPADLTVQVPQDAILLNPGKSNPAALALLKYLQGDKARDMIRSFGYEL